MRRMDTSVRELRCYAVSTTYGATRLTSGGFPPVSTQAL
ncbi:hypothetical protein P186_2816 [Pyrobaculum ferrireducens]|uniref:Uncharacterized protein n=1 Tax=Pyrobaculum ferrireducens TaxID=1104324 RepID=G7VF27_9CREN|nr:hypothetical protein P186_2816 [Pyrobaculum ferrireducens]